MHAYQRSLSTRFVATGVRYIRRDVQPRFWVTLGSGHLDDDATGAFRFMQYGTGSVPVVDGLMAALQFIQAIGIERIERWDLMLAHRLRDGLAQIKQARLLSPADRRLASAIATFAIAGVTGRVLQDALWEKKIRVRAQGQTVDRRCASPHISTSAQPTSIASWRWWPRSRRERRRQAWRTRHTGRARAATRHRAADAVPA